MEVCGSTETRGVCFVRASIARLPQSIRHNGAAGFGAIGGDALDGSFCLPKVYCCDTRPLHTTNNSITPLSEQDSNTWGEAKQH